MQFGPLVKVPDGRYYVKVSDSPRLRFNSISVPSFTSKPIIITIPDVSSVKSIEGSIIEYAKSHSEEWFGRQIAESTIEKAFQSSLAGDTFEAQFITSKGKILTDFWDAKKQPKSVDSEWGGTVDMIVEISGVWFLKKSFGPIFKILQVKETKQKPVRQCLFEDDDDDEEIDLLE